MNGEVWDAMLNQTDIGKNANKYAHNTCWYQHIVTLAPGSTSSSYFTPPVTTHRAGCSLAGVVSARTVRMPRRSAFNMMRWRFYERLLNHVLWSGSLRARSSHQRIQEDVQEQGRDELGEPSRYGCKERFVHKRPAALLHLISM